MRGFDPGTEPPPPPPPGGPPPGHPPPFVPPPGGPPSAYPPALLGTASVVTGRRVIAGLLDMAPLIFLSIAMGDRSAGSNGFYVHLRGWTVLWWLLASIAYYGISELAASTSPGKAITGLCVRSDSAATPTKRQIMTRNAMRIVDILPVMYLVGLIAALASRHRQRLGDMVANTVVLQRSEVGVPPLGRSAVLVLSAVVTATIGSGIALLALADNTDRVGDFELQAEVIPYAEQVLVDGFRPISEEGVRLHLAPELVADEEIDSVLAAMQDLVGGLTDDYEIVDHRLSAYPLPSGRTVESVDLLVRAEFEKRPGELILTISDIDGELRLIGFHFNA